VTTLARSSRQELRLSAPAFRLGLGCAAQGNLLRERSAEESFDVFQSAWDAGIRHFDTAPHYGLGLSERRLGQFLASKPRDQFVISTKVGRLIRENRTWDGVSSDPHGFAVAAAVHREWDLTSDGIRSSVEESLERLGLDRIDIAYVHDPETSGIDGAVVQGMESVAQLRDEGMVRAVGTGSMNAEGLLAAVQTGLADIIMLAGRYTLLDQSVHPTVLAACDRFGTRIVAAAIFNSGLLARTPDPRATYDYAEVPPEILTRARSIASVCAEHGVELATAAMHYPLLDPRVDALVVGAASPAQIEQARQRMTIEPPSDLWRDLDQRGLVPFIGRRTVLDPLSNDGDVR
jgi:D-threo-aldose 1-dehydrogenase